MIPQCPDAEYHYVDLETGELGPASRCRRSTCLFCVRVDARRIHRAVALAKPTLMINLTGLTGVWQTDRKMVNRLTYYLRERDGLSFSLAWAVEANPSGDGMCHAHGWSWGSRLHPSSFARRCAQVGLGQPFIKRVSSARNFAYVLKNATHNRASLAEHRRLNGREVIHARGFWRDPKAATLLTKQEALRLADPRYSQPARGTRQRNDGLPGQGRD